MFPFWFAQYMTTHNKTYSADHAHIALQRLTRAKAVVDRHVPTSYTLALNSRSDSDYAHTPWVLPKASPHKARRLFQVPEAFDWREYIDFSPSIDQGSCNACFAFAAGGVLEYWAQKLHKTVSVQHLVDCTPNPCAGGVVDKIFDWGGPYGLNTPYDGHKHKCTEQGDLHVKDYQVLIGDVEDQLTHALMQSPVAVGVDSAGSHYFHYSGGVFTSDACNKEIDHAMLLVGYTPDYWILKNSYGADWGENGYMNLERNKNACGIDTYATYVTEAV